MQCSLSCLALDVLGGGIQAFDPEGFLAAPAIKKQVTQQPSASFLVRCCATKEKRQIEALVLQVAGHDCRQNADF